MSDLQPIGGGLQPLGGGGNPTVPPTPQAAPVPSQPVATPPLGASGYSAPATRPATPARPAIGATPPHLEDDPDKPPTYLYVIGGVAALAAVSWVVSLFLPSAPVDAPVSYTAFAAANQSFRCELPQKWQVEAFGAASPKNEPAAGDGVHARQSDANIEITCSSVAGLITGQLLYGDNPIPAGAFGSRANPIFNSHGRGFKKGFKNYKETKLPPDQTLMPKMTGIIQVENTHDFVPDLRLAEFTADGNQFGLGGKRHGYRMTVGGSAQIVNMTCECSERDWKKLEPAFKRVIVSLAEPRPAGRGGVAVPGGATLPAGGGGVPGFGGSGL